MTEKLICVICREPIEPRGTWKLGCSAEPILPGRCCERCNEEVVVPIRYLRLKADQS